MPHSRRSVASLAAIAAGLGVAACGSSSSSPAPAATVTVTRTVVQSTPAAPASTVSSGGATLTTATATTAGRTVAPLGPECSASELTPSYLGSNGAAGTIELGFALTNSGKSTCHTYGWPGVEFLSSAGSALPTNPTRSTMDMAGQTPEIMINLKPGEQASFRLLASDFSSGGGSCATATQLQVYAPNDTVAMNVALAGGVPACGKTSVSPMQPGTSAYGSQ